MRLSVIIRRVRRSGFSSLFRPFPDQYNGTKKHIKIDDEERLLDDGRFNAYHTRQRSSHFYMAKMAVFAVLVLVVVGILLAYLIYKPPKFIINHLQKKYPDVLFQVDLPSPQKIVALTLDDAPSSETSLMLDLLKAYNAKATFFVIGGQIGGYSDILKRMHEEGHEIGNHAWADEPSIKLPASELQRQIKEVESLIPSNANGAKYFRPGSGFFNAKLVERVKSLGYRVVLGGIYPHDPQIHSPGINANHVLSMVRPGGIIIMHDRRPYSAEQLELVLKGLKKQNWTIESVGGLLQAAKDLKGKKASSVQVK